MKRAVLSAAFFLVCIGCGPHVSNPEGLDTRVDAGDNGTGDPGSCAVAVETGLDCYDGLDNDCDGIRDCEDPDCISTCNQPDPDAGTCGEAAYAGGTLAIPDGVGMSYETMMNIQGFDTGQTLQSIDGFVAICVNMEHSWLRDLQIEMLCPSGNLVVLQQFLGQTGGEVYMGIPDDTDNVNPNPGTGYDYCWAPTATNPPMLDWANANTNVGTLPPDTYAASGSWDPLLGCDLNGEWVIRATDDWGIDNGFIFDWSLEFNSDIISDCSGWDPIP